VEVAADLQVNPAGSVGVEMGKNYFLGIGLDVFLCEDWASFRLFCNCSLMAFFYLQK
jgi:hypothetical protein